MSKTFLISVERKGRLISAENIVGTRNYLPSLLRICGIIVKNGDPENCKIIVATIKKRTEIDGETIGLLGEIDGHDDSA